MAQSLLTKESPEIRQFFRNIDTLSRLLDIQAEKFRPLLNGDRYMTDSELAGKLKLTRRTLADYRLNGKIPYYEKDRNFHFHKRSPHVTAIYWRFEIVRFIKESCKLFWSKRMWFE